MKRRLKYLLHVIFMALGVLVITLSSLLHIQQTSRAQGGVIMSKILNKTSPVVRVGELVSFTVTLNNDAGFVLTNVTLIDNYEQNVMAFAGAAPVGPDIHDPTSGVLQWNNVAAPPIAVGETLTFTLFFTVEHPENNPVVNIVRAQDIMGSNAAISDTQAMTQADEATGNMAPVIKSLSPPDSIPQVGLPLTFTQVITNDGLATMTFLPLTDTYDANVLQFHFAIPPPNITSPGQLIWTDLTDSFGDLGPFETVVVTTVFTATAQVLNTVNEASTAGARDEFNNIMDGGQASVGIRIIEEEIASPPDNDDDDDDDDDDDSETVAPTPTPVSFPTPTPQTTVYTETTVSGQGIISESNTPRYLPETGQLESRTFRLLLIPGLLAFILALLAIAMKRRE